MKRPKKSPRYPKRPEYLRPKGELEARQRAQELKALSQEELDGALDTAVRFRDVLFTHALLEAGGNPNGRDGNNQTLLGHAIERHSVELAKVLLDHGADVNLPTILGTPLISAIFEKDWAMVDLLLRSGADVNKTGFVPSTALHVAAKYSGNSALVKQLLDHGAQVDCKDAEGLTALDWAQRKGNEDILVLLRQAVNARRAKGVKGQE